jgi:hypothetical protein
MGMFREMHEARSLWDVRDLRRKLSQAISRGYAEQIPVMKPHQYAPNREWYRDKETGEIFQLDPPDERPGSWDRVDPQELVEPGERIQ